MTGRLSQLCVSTTCHGVPDWYGAKTFRSKLFWAVVVLTAFGAIGYYQYCLVSTFLSVPTATKISKVVVDYLAFPNVTVCNQDSYSLKRVNAKFSEVQPILVALLNRSSTAIQFLQWLKFSTAFGIVDLSSTPMQHATLEQQYQILFNKSLNTGPFPKYDVAQFLVDVGYSCNDIFTQPNDCVFGRLSFNCCSTNQPIWTQFGSCYKLVPRKSDKLALINPSIVQTQPGINAGMEIIMTYNGSDSIMMNPSGIRKEGFYLSIGDHMSMLDNAAITVGPNMCVSVNLAVSRYQYDPSITTCSPKLPQLNYTKNGVASVLLCKQECQLKMNLQYCGCSPVYPNSQLPPDKICSPLAAVRCFLGPNSITFNDTYRQGVQYCQTYSCPKLCDTFLYSPFAVYSTIAPKQRFNTTLESSVATVYFGELAYTLNEEKPLMDLASLVSGFGGNLGLFAGISLITIVQCLHAFTRACQDGVAAGLTKGKPLQADVAPESHSKGADNKPLGNRPNQSDPPKPTIYNYEL